MPSHYGKGKTRGPTKSMKRRVKRVSKSGKSGTAAVSLDRYGAKKITKRKSK